MEVTHEPHVKYHRLETVLSESTELPTSGSGNGPFGNGPKDSHEHSETLSALLEQEIVAGLSDTEPTFRRGADFARLLSLKPDGVIEELGVKIVKRIGEVPCKDAEVKKFFGHKDMITRGLDTLDVANCAQEWKEYIREETRNGILAENRGLSESVTLAVYAVDLENAAAPLEEGVLTPLLKNVDEGSNSVDIWDIPAVRAIVEYKWDFWARRYLLIEFAIYMAWLISFLAFLVLYIQYDLNQGFARGQVNRTTIQLLAFIFDVCAATFMLPFIAIDINSIVYYKWQWLQMWHVIDCCAYILQVIITINHLSGFGMKDHAYKSILSIQCTMLFVKVQYFFRVVGVGVSYIETLRAVVYDVRYFLAFIITSTISASLSFAVLYTDHNKDARDDDNKTGTSDFGTVPKALVTTYAVLLGSFDPAYVFHTQNNVIKGIAFLIYQVCMSILVLNLLIAVVTESYAKTMVKKRALYNKGRAQLIGELEISLPEIFRNELKPYIHFAVIARRDDKEYELSALRSLPPLSHSVSNSDVLSKLKGIETLLQNLNLKLDRLQNQHNRLQKEINFEEEVS